MPYQYVVRIPKPHALSISGLWTTLCIGINSRGAPPSMEELEIRTAPVLQYSYCLVFAATNNDVNDNKFY